MFMTFHGEPRADEETMHHAHESPWVMLIPLIVLAIGATFFGWLGYDYFVGDAGAGFWKTAILVLPGHDALAKAEEIPVLIRYLPLVFGVAGIAVGYVFYIVDPRIPVRLAQRFRELYLFILNKWYFDELYDLLIVRPAMAIGDGLWKSGDGAVIDGLGPERARCPDPRSGATGEPVADRLCLSLRLRHDDRARGVRDLVSVAALSEEHLP